ncbi:MAG TPA: ABC transporter ATP-binding protein [Parapedobacter sp.]|nr:ABC transporter ATP-binding protein [Parapedobacter sp.]
MGLLDGFGLAMFIPLFQMIDGEGGSGQDENSGVGFLVNAIQGIGIELTLTNTLSLLIVFFVLKGVVAYINHNYEVILKEAFIKQIRYDIVEGLTRMQFKSFVSADVGRIQNTATGEVNKLSDAYATYFDTIQQGVLITVYMTFAFTIDASFAVLITIGGVLTNFLFTRIFNVTKRFSAIVTGVAHRYQGLVIQFVASFKYLKSTGSVSKMENIVKDTVVDLQVNNRRMGRMYALSTAVREPLLIVIVAVVIYLQINFFGGNLGGVIVSLLFFYRALAAVILMQSSYNHFLAVSGSLDNMVAFDNELKRNCEDDGDVLLEKVHGQIIMDDVSFGYGNKTILRNIDLTVNANETLAVVGESGSGKTTLINVLIGLLPSNSGRITVGGIDLARLNKATFRNRIGYIAQEPVVFNDTIFNNVTLWDLPNEGNRTRFFHALEQASLDEFVLGLPDKEETLLGNNGINISGGQKQRISIARELYKDIDILILDEATSALDSETEQNIQHYINKLKGQFTILIIAHRLSTIRNADRIAVLSHGEIIAIDSFDNLKGNSQHFKKMLDFQDFASQ